MQKRVQGCLYTTQSIHMHQLIVFTHPFGVWLPHNITYSSKGFSVANNVEVDVFLDFPCFFYDPTDVDNLVSGSSAFSKSSLYI